jgi:putative ABC transport system substrate-binding protein
MSESTDGLIVVPSRLTSLHRQQIAQFALRQHLPLIAGWGVFAQAGGLLSYGPNLDDMVRRAATHVDKILKGAKPAELPVEQPTTFDLVVNLKTAQALGLTVPQSILQQATEVIQ